jgi:glucuronosyltransferase
MSPRLPGLAWVVTLLLINGNAILKVESKKILISTMPGGTSHLLEIVQVAKYLGVNHEVALLVEDWDLEKSRSKLPSLGDTQFLIVSPFADIADGSKNFDKQVKSSQEESLPALKYFIKHQEENCRRLLKSTASLDKIKAFQPDLIIADTTYPCSSILADILHVPTVLFSPTTLIEPLFAGALGYEVLPSTVPAHSSGLPVPRNFLERMSNWAQYTATWLLIAPLLQELDDNLRTEFQIPPKDFKTVKLFLVNADFAVEFPRQLPDGIKFVGPLLAAPAKPLDTHISKLIENAQPFSKSTSGSGFLFVSFGSVFVLNNPLEIKTLSRALSSLTDYTILWRITESELPTGLKFKDLQLGAHVHTLSWAPQNDILGSEKLAAFISHGGTNSVYEAAYHGVPLVNIPFMGDHRDHAARAEARGFGVTVSRKSLAKGDARPLLDAIEKVVEDPKFKDAARRVGGELRAYSTPAAQRAAEWVEFALKLPENSTLSISDPAGRLYWVVRRSHDVHAALGIASIFVFVLLYSIFGLIGRTIGRLTNSATKKKEN